MNEYIAMNCSATNCLCDELSATNCPRRIVLRRIVLVPLGWLKRKISILDNNVFSSELTHSAGAEANTTTAGSWRNVCFATLTNILDLDVSIKDCWNNAYVNVCMKCLVGCQEV